MATFDSGYVPASAMAIFAHPDDAEFSTGATLAKWADAGCEVTLVVVTSGNVGTHDAQYTRESLAQTREAEQRAANERLGVKQLVWLGCDDCELQPTLALRRMLVRAIREFRPEVVLCGDPQAWFYGNVYINHPDHRAAAAAALEATFPCAEMELLWPEEGPAHRVHAVYISFADPADTWIDVTATMDRKIEALKCHASQMGDWDPTEMVRTWAAESAKAARRNGAAADTARKDKGKRKAKGKPKMAAKGRRGDGPVYVEGFRVMRLKADEAPVES
jgi:LmbE family N-acetylglucosaminyl deacetylase